MRASGEDAAFVDPGQPAEPEPSSLDGADEDEAVGRAAIEPTQPSDSDLILAIAQRRDKAAFAALFHRYERRLTAFAIRSGASTDQAEEAAQETLLTVWRKAGGYDPRRASAAAWLFTIARNKRIDMLRRGARPEVDPDDPVFAPEAPESAAASLSAERRDATVRAALRALTAEQRQVVEQSFFEGKTHREIADALGLPLGTVKSRLRLAFAKLRDALGEAFRDELRES